MKTKLLLAIVLAPLAVSGLAAANDPPAVPTLAAVAAAVPAPLLAPLNLTTQSVRITDRLGTAIQNEIAVRRDPWWAQLLLLRDQTEFWNARPVASLENPFSDIEGETEAPLPAIDANPPAGVDYDRFAPEPRLPAFSLRLNFAFGRGRRS